MKISPLAKSRPLFEHHGVVYPGHALTLAYFIIRTYPTLDAARSNDSGYGPGALADSRVPGGGGNVHAALDFLWRAGVVGVDAAIEHADSQWQLETETTYLERREPGQQQADSLKAEFRRTYAAWLELTQTPEQA